MSQKDDLRKAYATFTLPILSLGFCVCLRNYKSKENEKEGADKRAFNPK